MHRTCVGRLMNEGVDLPVVVDTQEVADSTGISTRSPGALLAARREAAGWSIEQVAAQLKLASRQIEAIETDHLEALPGTTVARGFIRSYAKLLKMDAAPLLAAISADVQSPIEAIRQQRSLATPFSEARLPSMKSGSTSRNRMLTLLIVFLVAAGIWAAQHGNWLFGAPHALWAAANVSLTKTAAVEKTQVKPSLVLSPAVGVQNVAMPVPKLDVDPVAPLPMAASAFIPVAAVLTDSVAPAASNDNHLRLIMHQDSWVEIKRKDGSILMSRIAKAGTQETFEIVEPISLVVGNAAGVDVTLRNIPVDLKSDASSNVARVTLK